MINAKEYKKEVDYLKSVLYTLEKEIAKQSQEVGNLNSDLQEEMKYTWDPTNRLNDTEFTYAIADIHRRSYSRNIITSNIKSYKRMIKSAYFARFDFDDGEDVMPVYLGIATLQNDDYFYVYDWRAPICSMFYDYEIGEASYQTPSGEIVKGKITLKRQYKIEGDTIKEVFDTDMQVIDNILQQMLSEKTSNKMRNIVSTIQKEQNKIIRKNDVDIMVVSGPAGSGKTSVAMHKIAYLLYSKRDKLSNSEILILSPNEIFSNYISNVLPQIGEDNVYQTTFMDYVNMFLTEYKIHGSLNDIYEKYYASTKPTVRYNSIKLKFSSAYINLIETYLARNRDEILGIKDIMIDGKLVMDKEFLSKLAAELDGCGLSYVEQSKKLMEKVVLHTTIKAQKTQNMSAKLKKYLQNDKIRPKDVYNKLYSDRDKFVHLVEDIYNTAGTSKADRLTIKELVDIFNYTASNLSKGIIMYEDVCPYLYIKDRLLGSISQNRIKYVIIDEAQDYSLIQYKILAGLFRRANITVLGDLNQCILPFSTYKSYDTVLNLLSEGRDGVRAENMYLSKTYRSTTEINTFAKAIVPDSPLYNQIERHGDKVLLREIDCAATAQIFIDGLKLKEQYNSVAIITKTQAEADALKDTISQMNVADKVRIITKRDKTFLSEKLMVIPAYLAKGLEFDAVLIANASEDVYSLAERNLFYVAVTRALHKLNIYYVGQISPLVSKFAMAECEQKVLK